MDPCIVDDSVEITTRCRFIIEFIIPKFFKDSTRFEPHTAHHQEIKTVFAASGLYAHMVTGRCEGRVGNIPNLGLTQPLTEMSTRNVSWG
jgi:hypothetical protein